jgi:AcrR family transcriptional regulator
MSSVEPKAQRVSPLRARILDAARRIVMREGIDALSMRKIADAIGYSPASLYLHFEGRDAIARALGHEGFTQLLTHLEPCAGIDPPRARLHALAQAYVAFGCAHPQTYRLMFLPARSQEKVEKADAAHEAPPDDEAAALIAPITSLFADAFASVCAEPALLARALWALLHGVVAFSLAGPAFADESAGLLAIDAALDQWIGIGATQKTPPDAT